MPDTTTDQSSDEDRERIAAQLGCITDAGLQKLANVKDTTTEAWRKRHTGPAWIRVGNTVLYPMQGLRELIDDEHQKRQQKRGAFDRAVL